MSPRANDHRGMPSSDGLLRRLFPIARQLAGYRSAWLSADILAGLSVAAVALPIAIAYPAIAGLPPEAGLYATILPLVGYALSRSMSNIGTAVDQLNTANIQDPNNPFDAPVQFGPTTDTDARHRINLSATFELPGGFRVSPIYLWRSALPVATVDGRDLNLDGDATEIPTTAFAIDSFDPDKPLLSQITTKQLGTCETVNCGRGMPEQRLAVRFAKLFSVGARARIEVNADVFNLFNSINPGGFRTRVIVPSTGLPDATLLQPTSFSGDFRRPEQRVGQVGVRFLF